MRVHYDGVWRIGEHCSKMGIMTTLSLKAVVMLEEAVHRREGFTHRNLMCLCRHIRIHMLYRVELILIGQIQWPIWPNIVSLPVDIYSVTLGKKAVS
jgi:hypothetical protein